MNWSNDKNPRGSYGHGYNSRQNHYPTAHAQYSGQAAGSDPRVSRDTQKYTLYEIPMKLRADEYPRPYPSQYDDRRDGQHGFVRMPCSPTETVQDSNSAVKTITGIGTSIVNTVAQIANYPPVIAGASLWNNILSGFGKKIKNLHDFTKVVRKYNPNAADGTQDFLGLENCLNRMRPEERVEFFNNDVEGIIRLAREVNKVVTCAPPLLRAGTNTSVSMSQYQAASLLANAFMCTFPDRNGTVKSSGRTSYPDFNFDRLFEPVPDETRRAQKVEKLRCILNYFRRVAATTPKGALTITRRKIPGKPEHWWRQRESNILENVEISSSGSIEEAGEKMVQIDFANKYIGGGVLGNGLVQEEIRFLQFPEMIITRLLCERMEDDEAVLVIGAERYNDTEGYARTFKWKKNYTDTTHMDEFRRRRCQIVAMDALDFSPYPDGQFELGSIIRELNKAIAGFSPFNFEPTMGGDILEGVATGNWGCGAFKGDPRLKFLIQLMAISEADRRKMSYYTYHDETLAMDLRSMHNLLLEKDVKVGRLFKIIENYSRLRKDLQTKETVFQFVSQQLGGGDKFNLVDSPADKNSGHSVYSSSANKGIFQDGEQPDESPSKQPRKSSMTTHEPMEVDDKKQASSTEQSISSEHPISVNHEPDPGTKQEHDSHSKDPGNSSHDQQAGHCRQNELLNSEVPDQQGGQEQKQCPAALQTTPKPYGWALSDGTSIR